MLNSKPTRHSWVHMKPLHRHPLIQARVLSTPPHRRHMLLHWLLQLRFLPYQWSPQVRLPPSLASHRLRALSQEYLPSHPNNQACLLGTSFTNLSHLFPSYSPYSYSRPLPPGFPMPPGFPPPGMIPPFPRPPGMVPPFPPLGVTPPLHHPSVTPPMIPGSTPVPPSLSVTPAPVPNQSTAPPPLTLPNPTLAQTNPDLKKKTVLKYSEPNFSPVSFTLCPIFMQNLI